MIAIDTETTGVDWKHGARPFFVTTCLEDGEQQYWEWSVDPLTRQPEIPEEDKEEVGLLILNSGLDLVLQNAKFDVAALNTIGVNNEWPWWRTHDTLLAGHLLASNQPHDLTSMAIQYLGVDIEPYELALKDSCMEARKIARKRFPEWAIAKAGRADMPSIKGTSESKKGRGDENEKPWKFDSWLPRAIALEMEYPIPDRECEHEWTGWICQKCNGHHWHIVLAEYSNEDSHRTLEIWVMEEGELKRRGLWEIYLERLKLLPVVFSMEQGGVGLSKSRLKEIKERFTEERETMGNTCLKIAKSYNFDLSLPKGASPNNSLRDFCFNHLKVPVIGHTDKGAPSLDKYVLEQYELTLEGKPQEFISTLRAKRKRDTGLSYLESYEKFAVANSDDDSMFVYSSVNPTGTDTLRFSSQNPNSQQIAKQETVCLKCKGDGCPKCKNTGKDLRSLRYVFGPAKGREWYCMDYENIELRIPAYKAGEKAMIELFERPNDPPYFGSNHLLFFDILHPDLFAKHGKDVKKVFASTWYQWTKNGDFAVQYGAVAESGTADRAYHVPGAQAKIESRLRNIKRLSQECIAFAEKYGYVETFPDKTVTPKHGYPLLCTRTQWGRILPTVPLSYKIQGTAMQCTAKAMVRCYDQCQRWSKEDGEEYRIVIQCHDELDFDFPAKGKKNLPKVYKLKRLMEQSGEDIGVPLKVAVTYNPVCWSEGVSV